MVCETGLHLAGFINSCSAEHGGKVPDPPGAAPRRVVLKPRADLAEMQTVKLRYGPFKVPNQKKKNLVGEYGMLYNYPDLNISKPCDGDCTIVSLLAALRLKPLINLLHQVGINAGLEYPDGGNANTDTGLWLHQFVTKAK